MKKGRKITQGVLSGIAIIAFILMGSDSEDWGVFIISHLVLLAIMIGSMIVAEMLEPEEDQEEE